MARVSGWREVPLGELARCQSGFAFKSRNWTTAGVPVVKIRDVRSGVVRLDGVSFVAADTAAAAERFLLRRGDVLITMSGEIGSVGVYKHDRPALLNQRVGRFELLNSSAADLNFLTFALQDPTQKQYFESVAYGVAQPNISPSLISRARVRIPSLATQRRIAAVLSAFDELIEINERRIELLEDLARSLYREWFVHFRFPGHEDVELVDSELGLIPEGWEVRMVDELAAAVRGRSYRRAELSESEGVPFLNLKCVKRGGGFRRYGLKRYIGRYKDTQRAVPGDVLVAVTDMTQERRIVAQAFRMPDLGEPFAVPSLDLALLKPMDDGMRPFLYATLRYSGFSESVRHFANGANVLHLAVDRILEYSLAIPDANLLRRFTMAVSPILDESEFLEVHNRQLAATRDLLLPRLVTGRLDISDIDLGVLTPIEVE